MAAAAFREQLEHRLSERHLGAGRFQPRSVTMVVPLLAAVAPSLAATRRSWKDLTGRAMQIAAGTGPNRSRWQATPASYCF